MKQSNHSALFDYINHIFNKLQSQFSIEKANEIEQEIQTLPVGMDKQTWTKMRVNQSQFRTALLNKFHQTCCLCGVNQSHFLIASHIKP